MSECKECIHYDDCGFVDLYNNSLTKKENLIMHCLVAVVETAANVIKIEAVGIMKIALNQFWDSKL